MLARHRRLHLRDQRLPRAQQPRRRRRSPATTSSPSTRSRASSSARAAATRRGARSSSAACSSGSARRRAMSVFNDLRQFKNPRARRPRSTASSPTARSRRRRRAASSSTRAASPRPRRPPSARASRAPEPDAGVEHADDHRASSSKTGQPLMVGGPQIGYFYPGLTYEIDMHAGDLQWRGATSAPFPGYVLIGRGEDFATHADLGRPATSSTSTSRRSATAATRSTCTRASASTMGTFDAGTLNGEPVTFKTTVHGPVVGYATVNGEQVAISLEALELRRGHARPALQPPPLQRPGQQRRSRSSRPPSLTPQTFNSFYIDDKNIAEYTAGRLPIRNKNVDPGLPTERHRQVRVGGLPPKQAAIRRASTRRTGRSPTGTRRRAKGFAAADDEWGRNGSVGARRPARQEPRPARGQEGQVDARRGDLGDERRRDAGRARDRHRAAAEEAAQGLEGARRRRRSRCSTLLVAWKQRRRQPPRPRPRRHDRRSRAPRSWTAPGRQIADAFMEPQLGPQLDELDIAVQPLRPAAGRPVRRLVPVLRPRHPQRCWG